MIDGIITVNNKYVCMGLIITTRSWLLDILLDDIDTLRPGQNCRHLAHDMFKCNFVNQKFCIFIPMSLRWDLFLKGSINNISSLVQIMAWRRSGDEPLVETMLAQFTDAYMRHYGEII